MDLQLHQPPSDRKPVANDADFTVLDDALLNSATPQMSPTVKARRLSHPDAPSSATFPSAEGEWRGFAFPTSDGHQGPAVPAPTGRSLGFAPFAPAPGVQFPPPSFWPVNTGSGSCTPTPGGMDTLGDFGASEHNLGAAASPPHGRTYSYDGALHIDTSQGFYAPQPPPPPPSSAAAAFPGSPHSSKGGWTSSSDGVDFRPATMQGPPPRSPIVSSTQLMRRDGIRKKNARFEIPAERNLRTIDQLINQTNDESEIKELKQQKRLLRNRQAAKKQHTERLEEEKKHYTAVITELEEHIADLKMQEGEWMRQKDGWGAQQHQYQACVEAMQFEKEELVRRHTLETADLRQKNALLLEQLQRMDSSSAVAMSAAPSSTGFSGADFSDFGELSTPWDDFGAHNRFTIETAPEQPPPVHMTTAAAPANVAAKAPDAPSGEEEKTVASGLLLMLLLCGAWVASRGGSSAASASLLPAIPDDMRAASATLLDDLYRDSGVHLHAPAPAPFGVKSEGGPPPPPQASLAAGAGPLDPLHHHALTAPTPQQLHEQAFTLTPAQYNRLTGADDALMSPPLTAALEPPRAPGARSLRDAVATLVTKDGAAGGGAAAETYTRSLMRDRVPAQVLHDFARMVAQTSSVPADVGWHHEGLD